MSDVLIIDTSTDSVALSVGSSIEQSVSIVMPQHARHNENIMLALDKVLLESSILRDEINAVAVGIGPGMFSGLRVGIAVAHSYAHSLDIPIVFLSSLEIAARATCLSNNLSGEVIIARDARRSELYFAHYIIEEGIVEKNIIDSSSVSSSIKRIQQESLITPNTFVQKLKTFSGYIFIDDAVRKVCGQDFGEYKCYDTVLDPRCMIGDTKKSVELGVVGDVYTPMPLYIRKSDAELSWGTS